MQVRRARGYVAMRRAPGQPTPCHKCPKGKPDSRPHPERELSPRNWRAYQLYYQVKAGAPMPDDPIVRQNCGVIRMIEDGITRSQASQPALTALLLTMFGAKRK